jgi:hypothetical protein
MKRLVIPLLVLMMLAADLALVYAAPQYTAQGSVSLAPARPQLTAVDPYANAASPSTLKPARPFWYSVDKEGLTIMRLYSNTVVYRVPWPTTIDIVQPDGEYENVAMTVPWEPVGMVVSYPTEEQLASNSETPSTYVYVVMARSGYEWQSEAAPPAGRDPNVRDKLVPTSNPARESSMLVQVDVTDPSFLAAPPSISGAILGHGAGQPAFDPATGNVYVGNMPSTSLPTTPRDLTSFVSVIAPLAPPAAEAAGGELPGAPEPPMVVICGPEHPNEGLLVGEPYVWPCVESGDGPAVWEFQNLPSWLSAHLDKVTGKPDGLLYGIPPDIGSTTYQARVIDYGEDPDGLASDWVTFTLNVTPSGVASEVEAGFEAGIPGGQGVAGTGDCTPAPTSSPGSVVPAWVDVRPALLNNVFKGCFVMGTAPISGEHYEFTMPGFHFAYPFQYTPVIFSGDVAGPYVFDPLPAGAGISGLAWHEIDKIHDASTEADILNAEFIGIDPFTGQMYQILPPQGAPEGSGAAVAPPEISVEGDEISAVGTPLLASLTASRSDIAAALLAHPNMKVRFGDVAVEASRDPNVYLTAPQISDPTGADPTIVPIGAPSGSAIESGALLKVSGTRDVTEATIINWTGISTISLPGVQARYLGLDSNLSPAIRGTEPGQVDNGVLWVTGTSTGSADVIDTVSGSVTPKAVTNATSLGGVSVDYSSRSAYLAAPALQGVIIFSTGTPSAPVAPTIWGISPGVGIELTYSIGAAGSNTILATGWPTPTLSVTGTLPPGLTFVNNGDGTATLSGTPVQLTGSDYSLTLTAKNGVGTDATTSLLITIQSSPVITSPNTTTFTVGVAGSFTITTAGGPAPSFTCPAATGAGSEGGTVVCDGNFPPWLTFTDNDDGTGTLTGTPPAGSAPSYVFTIVVTNDIPPDATQNFTLVVAPSGTQTVPTVTIQPANVTVAAGATATFASSASGNPAPSVQWQFSINQGATWGTLAGATRTSYTTPATTTAMNGYWYRAAFTNSAGSAYSDAAMLTVTAAGNSPPVAMAQSVTTQEDTAVAITLVGSDPDQNLLTYAVVTQPQHGAVTGTAPNLTYTPAANYNGLDSFAFKVNDGKLDSPSATVSITVTPVNDPPVATGQSVTTLQDTTKMITLRGSDPDGDVLTYAVVSQPNHGSLTGTAPSVVYTPVPGYTGPDSFTFNVNDGTVNSSTATVLITVNPAIVPLAVGTTPLPNGVVTVAYSAQLQATGGVPPYRWSVSSGRIPLGLKMSTSGLLSGSPNVPGNYTFTARVSDSASAAASKSFTVTIAPRPPRR